MLQVRWSESEGSINVAWFRDTNLFRSHNISGKKISLALPRGEGLVFDPSAEKEDIAGPSEGLVFFSVGLSGRVAFSDPYIYDMGM